MMRCMPCIIKCASWKLRAIECITPFVTLAVRLFVGNFFWQSGMLKIANWPGTLYLFENEYKVPLLAPDMAAILATVAELVLPVLLVFGLGARIAAVGMLAMIAVAEFGYAAAPENTYMAVILAMLLFQGPGRISVDYWIRKKCM